MDGFSTPQREDRPPFGLKFEQCARGFILSDTRHGGIGASWAFSTIDELAAWLLASYKKEAQ